MSFPAFLIPYFIGASPVGMIVFVAKAGIYCLFHRRIGAIKVFGLALFLHLLSSVAGIGAGLLILPGQGFGWNPVIAVYYLYAAAWSMGCEFLCLFLMRKNILQRWS